MKKTSLSDISQALGVSKTLVSMVLNGRGNEHGINQNTQKKVLDKAKEMNYRPNPMARSLRTGKTNTIGLIVADIANPFFAKISRSIEDEARKHNLNLFFSSSDENSKREENLIHLMRNQQVDGLIISSTLAADNSKILESLQKEKFPFVLIDRYIPGFNFDVVDTNNKEAAIAMTRHLVNSGKKRIALLNITPDYLSPLSDRIDGFKTALIESNIKIDENLIFNIPFDNVEKGVESALEKIISNKPDAIFTLNNHLAGACLKYFVQHKIKVPQDISLVSFDNVDWFEFSNPPITAVKQPIEAMGAKAVERLIEKIKNNESKSRHTSLPSELIIRSSC